MIKKYEFTGETTDWFGVTLKRIRATIDFTLKSGIKVTKGDLGGWIEKEENLSQMGLSWVYGEAWVYSSAKVYGNAEVSGYTRVYSNAKVYDNARVCGHAKVHGNAEVFRDVCVYDNAEVYGEALVFDDAKVSGHAQVYGDAEVCGNAQVYGNAHVFGDAIVCGDAEVEKSPDVIWFKNIWSSGRTFTYTRSNGKWKVGCFYGNGEELIKKAYADSEASGKCYEAIVRVTEEIYKVIDEKGGGK